MTENFGDPKGAEQPFSGIAYAQPSGYLYWYKPNPKKGNTSLVLKAPHPSFAL